MCKLKDILVGNLYFQYILGPMGLRLHSISNYRAFILVYRSPATTRNKDKNVDNRQ